MAHPTVEVRLNPDEQLTSIAVAGQVRAALEAHRYPPIRPGDRVSVRLVYPQKERQAVAKLSFEGMNFGRFRLVERYSTNVWWFQAGGDTCVYFVHVDDARAKRDPYKLARLAVDAAKTYLSSNPTLGACYVELDVRPDTRVFKQALDEIGKREGFVCELDDSDNLLLIRVFLKRVR